jgi:hypothetical protein
MKYSGRYLAHLKELEQKQNRTQLTHVEHKRRNAVDRGVSRRYVHGQ